MISAMSQPLCDALREKIQEQIERTTHLIAMAPDSAPNTLLGHLLECAAGFCAVLYAANPESLAHFLKLRERPVNHACGAAEARGRLAIYASHIDEGFTLLTDADLARSIPTVFKPAGETLITLLLGNLEHLINHKHELFARFKAAGVAVGTPDLYRLRS
jgi:hypothetical protein